MSLSKKAMHNGSIFSPSHELNKRVGSLFFFISFLIHGLFFAGILLFHDFKLPKPMPPVIQIDLVSFSPEPATEGPEQTHEPSNEGIIPAKSSELKKPEPKNIPNIKPDISLKTKPKNLKQLMEKKKVKEKKPEIKNKDIPKPKPQIEEKKEAEPKPEQNLRNPELDKIHQALSRLEKTVKEQGKPQGANNIQDSAGHGKKGYKPIDLYNLVIGSTIEQNWVFNDILANMNQNLEVRVLIKVLKSGEIRDIIYETRSGNRYLDESAKKAIKKANPLPPLPPGLHSYDVGLIFTPKGLK